jgi:hypothetical protein
MYPSRPGNKLTAGETPSSHDIIPTLFGETLIQIILATARSIYPACRMNERELP